MSLSAIDRRPPSTPDEQRESYIEHLLDHRADLDTIIREALDESDFMRKCLRQCWADMMAGNAQTLVEKGVGECIHAYVESVLDRKFDGGPLFPEKSPDDPQPGQVWEGTSENPFERLTVTVKEVREGFVLYTWGERCSNSCSLAAFKKSQRRVVQS